MGLGSHDPRPIAASARAVPAKVTVTLPRTILLPVYSSVYRYRPRDSAIEGPTMDLKLSTGSRQDCLGFVWLWR